MRKQPVDSAATPQIKDTTITKGVTIVENLQLCCNLARLYLNCGRLCQSDKTFTKCCKDNLYSNVCSKMNMVLFRRFHNTKKSLHFGKIARQSNDLQRHRRFDAILPLWQGNMAANAFLQCNHQNRLAVWSVCDHWDHKKRVVGGTTSKGTVGRE